MHQLCSATRRRSKPTCKQGSASSHKAGLQVPMQPPTVHQSTDKGHCDPQRGRPGDARQAAWLHQGVCMETNAGLMFRHPGGSQLPESSQEADQKSLCT